VIGLVAAIAIGLGIYRGGVRINLNRFFPAVVGSAGADRRRIARGLAGTMRP
jgi:hypothetical protein